MYLNTYLENYIRSLNESNQSTQLKIHDLIVEDITLLSIEEVEQVPEEYRKFYGWWWLRSPGDYQHCATCVRYDGSVYTDGHVITYDNDYVRPALIVRYLKVFNLPLYSEVELDDKTKWLVISDNTLLCNDDSFGKHEFDIESNDYEKSEIKQYIHDKAKELGLLVYSANKVNHKNKKKLVVLDESKINVDLTTNLNINNLDIQDITLLSIKEAEQIPQIYREFYGWWWLRSPSDNPSDAAYVGGGGLIHSFDSDVDVDDSYGYIRPALIINNLKSFNLPLYSEVELDNGTKWLVISDNMLLCDVKSFGQHRFDEETNNYNKSEIKQYIYEKAKELGFNNIGVPISRKVNHKNKKKLVVLDESQLNKSN